MQARNSKQLLIGVALFFFSAMMMTGCGGSSTGLMGGAIQGRTLSLIGTTSTLAGTAGTTGSKPMRPARQPALIIHTTSRPTGRTCMLQTRETTQFARS
jgi:hypothetical protein